MNKESIYQIIGYHGEYTESVKKALKKLLKDNHPDHGGNSYIFELVTIVKKELETGNVSYKCKSDDKTKKYDDIDYDYCKIMIEKLQKDKNKMEKEIKKDKLDLDVYNRDYKVLYRKSVEKEVTLLNNKKDIENLNKLKKILIVLLIFLILTFTIAIIKNQIIFFILFGIIALVTIIEIKSFYITLNSINKKNANKLSKYISVISKIRDITDKKQKLEDSILVKERKRTLLENDLRFYINLINNK